MRLHAYAHARMQTYKCVDERSVERLERAFERKHVVQAEDENKSSGT